jgi:hypothetical protein
MGIVCILVNYERGRKRKMIYKNLKEIIAKHKENMPVIATAELLAEID